MFSYTLDGIPFSDGVNGIENFALTLERTFDSDNLYRERVETSLTFTGRAYCYLCDKLAEDYCANVTFELFMFSEPVFSGAIIVSFGLVNWYKKTFETQIVDATYRGFLAERIKNEVRLDSLVTINCQPISPIPVINQQFFQFNLLPFAGTRPVFDVKDVFTFIINFISDNTIAFESDYFTANKYYITTGWNLQANFIQPFNRRFPTVSFEFMYNELRKLFALYASIEDVAGVPTLRIEPETYWFANTPTGYSLPDFSEDTIFSVDEDRIYSIAKIGSSKVDPESAFNFFVSGKADGWTERTYNSCGCVFDKNNEQDNVTNLVIDSAMIFESLTNGKNPDDLYLIEGTNAGAIAVYAPPVIPTKIYYNDKLRNKNVAQRWSALWLNCAYSDRVNDTGFRIFNDKTTAPFSDCEYQWIRGTGALAGFRRQAPIDCTIFQRYMKIDYDNLSSTAFAMGVGNCDLLSGTSQPCGQLEDFSYFQAPVDGNYAFTASRFYLTDQNVIQAAPPNNTMVVAVALFFEIYSDSTFTTFVSSFAPAIQIESNFTTGFANSITSVSGLVPLQIGQCVRVAMRFIVSTDALGGGQIIIRLQEGEFRTLDDLMACGNDIPTDATAPYLMSFSTEMCKSQYDLLNQNRRSTVTVNGITGWIKSLTYDPKGRAEIVMYTQTIACNDTN